MLEMPTIIIYYKVIYENINFQIIIIIIEDVVLIRENLIATIIILTCLKEIILEINYSLKEINFLIKIITKN